MPRRIIATDQAPGAIGPYNQAIASDGWVFTAGQIPLDPQTMEVVGETAPDQARQALRNAQAVLQAASASLTDVVKVTVFVRDMGQFAAINEVYREFFPEDPPARSVVEVSGLPKDVQVEVEMIAHR